MAQDNKWKCGPNAEDQFGNYDKWSNVRYTRSHNIVGTGSITNCCASDYSSYFDSINRDSGIT